MQHEVTPGGLPHSSNDAWLETVRIKAERQDNAADDDDGDDARKRPQDDACRFGKPSRCHNCEFRPSPAAACAPPEHEAQRAERLRHVGRQVGFDQQCSARGMGQLQRTRMQMKFTGEPRDSGTERIVLVRARVFHVPQDWRSERDAVHAKLTCGRSTAGVPARQASARRDRACGSR